jgi:hypothetical protein
MTLKPQPAPQPILLKPWTPPPPPIPTNQQLALNLTRQDTRARAALRLNAIHGYVGGRAAGWRKGARHIGNAYAAADKAYNTVLEKQKTLDTLKIQAFFSVLTIATSGALGWATIAAETRWPGLLKLGNAMTETRDAISQAMVGEAFASMGPLVFPATPDSTVNPDPQKFQNELEDKVDDMSQWALNIVTIISNRFADAPLEAWDCYNAKAEEAAFRDWQKMEKQLELASDKELPDEDWMARELERGRWAKYVLDQHSHLDFGLFQTEESPDDVGSLIVDHLKNNLGVTAAVSPELHGKQAGMAIRYAVRKQLWDWAKKYEVRKFTDEKKNPKGGGPDHQ